MLLQGRYPKVLFRMFRTFGANLRSRFHSLAHLYLLGIRKSPRWSFAQGISSGRLFRRYFSGVCRILNSERICLTKCSIIAIHGLGTTTPRTWEYKTKTGVVSWLSDSDMLPDIVPSARIYTFSWNANYYSDASIARIENVAEVLLSNLQNQRDKVGT